MNTSSLHENEIGTRLLAAAVEVHQQLGPGLLESVYQAALAEELRLRGLMVRAQVPVPIVYKEVPLGEGFRADLVIEGKVLVELKSVEQATPAHRKQVQTYLRLTGLRLGYLLNFGHAVLREGITRCVNRLEENPAGGAPAEAPRV